MEAEDDFEDRNKFFDAFCDLCFFDNEDTSIQALSATYQVPTPRSTLSENFKTHTDKHDNYTLKLQFFTDCLQAYMRDTHIPLFCGLLGHPRFRPTVLSFLEKGE